MEELLTFIAEIVIDGLISVWKSRKTRTQKQLFIAPPVHEPMSSYERQSTYKRQSSYRRRTKHRL